MSAYVWGIGVALAAAVCVLLAANAWGDERVDLRTFWRDLRSGLRRDEPGDEQPDEQPVDVHLEELFARGTDDGYLQLDELAELIERTGERAGRLLHSGHLPLARDRGAEREDAHV